ncbi:MAG: hypothetical protein RQ751_08785, partial [Longimicrobiales bacterium]|nr:hypothetical protein [Longimicrobiales bacterium]
AWTAGGPVNLRNARHRDDPRPLAEGCACPACRGYSRAYLHHLVRAGEAWTGTLAIMGREVALKDVKVEGSRVSFTMEFGPPQGAGGRGPGGPIVQTFTGTLEGDEIRGEMEGPRGAQPMVLKRREG